MLKKILILSALCGYLFALDIDVKLAKSKGEKYSILNLESAESFVCYKNEADEAPKNNYICEFEKAPKVSFSGFDSEFFNVKPYNQNGYKLSITSKTKSDIFSQNFDPKSQYEKKAGVEKRAKKFVIVAYEKELKFVIPKKRPALNFPVSLNSDPYVYVKTLDIDGLPISDTNSLQDIAEFNAAKKMYQKGDYKSAQTTAEKAQKSYPNSIFFSEYELLRIKSLVAMGGAANNTAAIELGKNWLKNFPADEKAPEVLLALMNAFAKNQDFKNADYYYERITTDFAFLELSKQAMIDYGDALKFSKAKRAIDLYKRALFETKNIETASIAAFKAADTYLSTNDTDNAKLYYGKILKGNMNFILKDTDKAYSFAKKLAGALIYTQAIEVGEALLAKMDKKNQNYEQLLSEIGEWAANIGDNAKAKSYYTRYLSEFGKGRFAHLVEPKLDKLNFGTAPNMGVAELLAIANKYPKEQVGQKALLKAMKALVENKKYADVLAMEPKTTGLPKELAPEALSYVVKSEKEMFAQRLAKSECKEAITLLAKNRIAPLASEEPKLFDCYMATADFTKALAVAQKNLAQKDLQAKLPWLYKFESAAIKLGKSKEAYGAAKDVLTLSKIYKKDEYSGIAFDAATLALNYKDSNLMTDAMAIVDSKYARDPKSITAYKSAIRFAISKNDMLSNLKYSEKLYNLQNSIKVFVETPWVEFNYAGILAKQGEHKKAAAILESALGRKISDSDRARALFDISSNYTAANDRAKAKNALNECVKVKADSSWKKLCKDSLELLK
jgi:TolA-binding protein